MSPVGAGRSARRTHQVASIGAQNDRDGNAFHFSARFVANKNCVRFGAWWVCAYAVGECIFVWRDKLELPEYPTICITLGVTMDIEDYLTRLLPHRLDALAIAVLMLKFRLKWEEPKSMQIFVDGRLQFEGSTTLFTNPTVEIGVLHARALLEFIGLKANKDGLLRQVDPKSRQLDDAAIERITGPTGALPLVSPEDVGAILPNNSEVAKHAIVNLIVAAHKGLAHTSATYFANPRNAQDIMLALELTQKLVEKHVYSPLGRQRPPVPVNARAQ